MKLWRYEFVPDKILPLSEQQELRRKEWDGFIAAMHSGEVFECDQEMYYYWLEVLPPAYLKNPVTLPNGEQVRADFGFAEGPELITVFWRKGERFFGCRTNIRRRD